ncbi:receptor-like protein EIX1, partial [Tanacetum coccineum]
SCLWHFKELRVLNLAHNSLSGRLPASIGSLIQLEVFYLYNNSFSGELPSAMKNCTSLNFLYLGINKFSGNVPVWIGENLSRLYVLSLRSNNFIGPIPLQLCQLVHLQVLDLSKNNLSGTIPSCINNIKAMVNEEFRLGNIHMYEPAYKSIGTYDRLGYDNSYYMDYALIMWQGNEREFSSNLALLKNIDLSSNNLDGSILDELTELYELLALNFSNNALTGEVPLKIGHMNKLLILDMSRNSLSGSIPSSMSRMTSLDYLDFSYNNMSGRIPSSTQLQSFGPLSYSGNVGLCGPPLTTKCPGDERPERQHLEEDVSDDDDEFPRWFYIGGGIGFAIGFWITCGVLILYRRGRHAYFHFINILKDWIYVRVAVFVAKLCRVALS